MKSRYFVLAALVFAAHTAVADTKKPASNWTCEEFLAVEGDFQPKVIYWATAKVKSGKPADVVDIEGTEKVVPMVIDDCKKTPNESFISKLKSAWRAVEAEAKKLKGKL
jgi:acid stress chaperone HdeA